MSRVLRREQTGFRCHARNRRAIWRGGATRRSSDSGSWPNELARVEASRATPRVDQEDVWVIPCITVRKSERGRGIAFALIRAAVAYAAEQGVPAVEADPRAGSSRTADDSVYYGSEPLFRRAGFRVVRKPLKGIPRSWAPRVTMRLACARPPASR